MQSIKKKIDSLTKNGLSPLVKGVRNFRTSSPEIEDVAKKRFKICSECPNFKTEPIPLLWVNDEKIPEASKKMCDDCGCTISLKIRQNENICKNW